jgi:hypothetical protein
MELWIGGLIVLAISGFIIYSMRDEDNNGWDN